MFDLCSCVAFGESKAIAYGAAVSFCLRAYKLSYVRGSEERSSIPEVDYFAARFETEAIQLTIHSIKLIVLDVMQNRLALDRTTLASTLSALLNSGTKPFAR